MPNKAPATHVFFDAISLPHGWYAESPDGRVNLITACTDASDDELLALAVFYGAGDVRIQRRGDA